MSKCMVAFIDWYHERMDGEGGREKIKNARTRGDPHTHMIQRVQPFHEGLYTCVVGNGGCCRVDTGMLGHYRNVGVTTGM